MDAYQRGRDLREAVRSRRGHAVRTQNALYQSPLGVRNGGNNNPKRRRTGLPRARDPRARSLRDNAVYARRGSGASAHVGFRGGRERGAAGRQTRRGRARKTRRNRCEKEARARSELIFRAEQRQGHPYHRRVQPAVRAPVRELHAPIRRSRNRARRELSRR